MSDIRQLWYIQYIVRLDQYNIVKTYHAWHHSLTMSLSLGDIVI